MVILAIVSISFSCGGGSGDGDSDNPFFGGVYDVSLNLISSTCGPIDATLNLVNTVNQDGRIVVLDSGSLNFTGEVNDENDGFTVSRSDTGSCPTGLGSAFAYLETDQSTTFNVGFAIVDSCASCEIVYGGTASLR